MMKPKDFVLEIVADCIELIVLYYIIASTFKHFLLSIYWCSHNRFTDDIYWEHKFFVWRDQNPYI